VSEILAFFIINLKNLGLLAAEVCEVAILWTTWLPICKCIPLMKENLTPLASVAIPSTRDGEFLIRSSLSESLLLTPSSV
jgi:hypothetical protein